MNKGNTDNCIVYESSNASARSVSLTRWIRQERIFYFIVKNTEGTFYPTGKLRGTFDQTQLKSSALLRVDLKFKWLDCYTYHKDEAKNRVAEK